MTDFSLTNAAGPRRIALLVLMLAPPFTGFLQAFLREFEGAERLTTPQFRALDIVARHPGLSLTEMAAAMGIAKPTASVLLLRMFQMGLLRKEQGPGRTIALHLTADGERRFRAYSEGLITMIEKRLAHLDGNQSASLAQSIETLIGIFDPALDLAELWQEAERAGLA